MCPARLNGTKTILVWMAWKCVSSPQTQSNPAHMNIHSNMMVDDKISIFISYCPLINHSLAITDRINT